MASNEAYSFAYVILQYGRFDLTQECIESIVTVDARANAVVVDNCSPDDALTQLRAYASGKAFIHIIASDTNSGFSRGNNIGYEYAITHFDPDFVVVLNSDVVLKQQDFTAQVGRIYEETGFGVLGPDIFVPARKCHQNPHQIDGSPFHFVNPTLAAVEEAEKERARQVAQLSGAPTAKQKLKRFMLKTRLGRALLERRSERQMQRAEEEFQRKWNRRMEDVPLQGACYIFSRKFTSVMEHPFYPEPFLYCEETLLHINCRHKGLKMVYDPAVHVIHNAGSSTMAALADPKASERQLFMLEHMQQSLHIVRQHIIDLEEAAE